MLSVNEEKYHHIVDRLPIWEGNNVNRCPDTSEKIVNGEFYNLIDAINHLMNNFVTNEIFHKQLGVKYSTTAEHTFWKHHDRPEVDASDRRETFLHLLQWRKT